MNNTKRSILLVEDDVNARKGIVSLLNQKYNILDINTYIKACNILNNKAKNIDLVITDLQLPGLSGLDLLLKIKKEKSYIPVIIITAHGNIEIAVNAIKNGAYDFVTKPIDFNKLEIIIDRAIESKKLIEENINLKKQIYEKSNFSKKIIGNSTNIQKLFNIIKQIAPLKSNVLITGESGTGKELVANLLHDLSKRDGNFITVNLAALPSTLLESELFGHEKGAFTGAFETQKGRFELADKGTIFLDEISEIDESMQVKLLRVIENKTFERIGSSKSINVDTRIIAASNKNLLEMVNNKLFRMDLFYRLNVLNIEIPSLRDRKSDIPLLINHFINFFSKENNKKLFQLSKNAMEILLNYNWPGNVRELKNCIERMFILHNNNEYIDVSEIPQYIIDDLKNIKNCNYSNYNIKQNEKKLIKHVMNISNSKISAAKILGITRKTLDRKLKEYEK